MGPQPSASAVPAAAAIRRRAVAALPPIAFVLVAAFVLTAFVLAAPAPALAHNSLTGSSPKAGARVATPPDTVRLSFLSKLDPKTTTVTVTGPAGAAAAAGQPSFAGKRVTVPFRAGPPGLYTIAYEVQSGDGHPIRGQVTFTLTTGAEPSPTASPEAPSPAPAQQPTDTAAAAPPVERAADNEGTPWWPWAVGGVAALVLVAGGAFVAGRRRT